MRLTYFRSQAGNNRLVEKSLITLANLYARGHLEDRPLPWGNLRGSAVSPGGCIQGVAETRDEGDETLHGAVFDPTPMQR
jgi:hypothetical protein